MSAPSRGPVPPHSAVHGSAGTPGPGTGVRGSGGRTADRKAEQSRGKLVRDRIPDIIRATGAEPIIRTAAPAEYRALLLAKLAEEVTELSVAHFAESREHVAEEAADVMEVVLAIAAHHGIDAEQLEKIRAAKAQERGGFADGIVWTGNRPAPA